MVLICRLHHFSKMWWRKISSLRFDALLQFPFRFLISLKPFIYVSALIFHFIYVHWDGNMVWNKPHCIVLAGLQRFVNLVCYDLLHHFRCSSRSHLSYKMVYHRYNILRNFAFLLSFFSERIISLWMSNVASVPI